MHVPMWSNAIFPENTENYGFETGVKGCINDPKLHLFLHHFVVPRYLELESIPIVSEVLKGLETLDLYPWVLFVTTMSMCMFQWGPMQILQPTQSIMGLSKCRRVHRLLKTSFVSYSEVVCFFMLTHSTVFTRWRST